MSSGGRLVGVFVLISAAVAGVLLVVWGMTSLDVDDGLGLGPAILVAFILLPLAIALAVAILAYLGLKPETIHLGAIGQFAVLVILAGGFTVGMVATIVLAARQLKLEGVFRPEIALPLLLVAGLIALVVALATLVAAFHLFDLADKTKPFGVPEGTLQAVIALTLILIFAITSLYLRGSFDVEPVTVPGLTQAQIDAIPGSEILSKIANEEDPTRFDIQRRVPLDEDAKDFSTQLLTILGTLVGAVAGFYFGAKSVETGISAGGSLLRPANTSPPSIGGSPLVGESLRADDGGWTGSPAPKLTYQWQRKRPTDADWTDVVGASTATYLIPSADVGSILRVAVIASNEVGTQSASSAETSVVLQAPTPPGTGVTISGSPQVGEELNVTQDAWTGAPPPTLTYEWQRKKAEEITWQAIPRAAAEAYRVADEDAGYTIRVIVTGANAAGTQQTSSPETAAVLKAPEPPATGVTIIGNPLVGGELAVTHGAWTGAPPPMLTYEWQRKEVDWVSIPEATADRYRVTDADIGYALRATVTGTNAAGRTSVPSNETSPASPAPAT